MLSALWTRVDAGLTEPEPDRRRLSQAWVAELGGFVERRDGLAARLSGTMKRADPIIDRLMTIQQLGWIVRDYVGRDRLALGSAIAAPDLAATPAWQRETGEYRARVHGAWTALRDVLAGPSDIAGLQESIARAKAAYFDEGAPVRDRIQGALLAGQSSGYRPHAWITFSNPALAALIGVPSAAIELANQRAAATGAARSTVLAKQAVLALLSVLVSVFGFVLVTRRVIDPLTALTDVMHRLARGDLRVDVPGTDRRDGL